MSIRQKVFEALDNAQENGHWFESIYEATKDLLMYDSELEHLCYGDIVQYVEEWMYA